MIGYSSEICPNCLLQKMEKRITHSIRYFGVYFYCNECGSEWVLTGKGLTPGRERRRIK